MTRGTCAEFGTIGLIGPGRMGSALAESLYLNGQPIHAIAGRHAECPKALLLAQRVGAISMSAQALAQQCSLIFIATPDDDIAPLAASLQWSAGSAVIHLSGATDISALLPATYFHAYTGSFHPLQSISQPKGTASTFQQCTITIEAADPYLCARLVGLVKCLGGRVNVLPANARMRYHAAANHASALLTALLLDMARLWESWGSSESEMLDALLPLMQGTLTAAKTRGIAQALTGPLARGDVSTLEGHLAALKALDPELAKRYAMRHQTLVSFAPLRQRQRITSLLEHYSGHAADDSNDVPLSQE